MANIREGHILHILPTVRIQKIVIDNLKGIRHGEVVFNCAKKFISEGTESDVLGIYGQNGSGKTSVIDALSILKFALMGEKVPEMFCELISAGAEYSRIETTFDFQYKCDSPYTRTIIYSFKMRKEENITKEEKTGYNSPDSKWKVCIFDEEIKAAGPFEGKELTLQPVLTAFESQDFPLGPSRKTSFYISKDIKPKEKTLAKANLTVYYEQAIKSSRSFIFSEDTLKVLRQNGYYSDYYQILLELNHFGTHYLFAITHSLSRADSFRVPYNSRHTTFPIPIGLKSPNVTSKDFFNTFLEDFNKINGVLSLIIPGLHLKIKELDAASVLGEESKSSEDEVAFVILSMKKDGAIRLKNESEGILKIISVISMIISAFNEKSLTVAIDEFDAGIYEYLLGEILAAFEEYGKGQLIFTSHNLRPLEVLNKEHILFTTSNPDNRFIRLKGVGKTNNLRDVYLREILNCRQGEELYSSAKRYKMIAAFQNAGGGTDEE